MKKTDSIRIYAPNSIYHDMAIHDPTRLPISEKTLLQIENNRLTDFIEFLFEHSEHCDHISQRDAWNEFSKWEAKRSRHRKIIKNERKNLKENT